LALIVVSICVAGFAQSTGTSFDPATAPHVLQAEGSGWEKRGGLGDRLTLKVRNLPVLLAQVSNNCKAIVLFLDGLPLRGLPPDSCDPYNGTVKFLLDSVPDENDAQWHRLLGSPNGFLKQVSVSIGASDQFAVPTDVHGFQLEIIPGMLFYFFLALFVVSLVLFFYLCRTTTIIRSPAESLAPRKRPYSLSRFQMAFWFFLVIAGYVFVWMITGELDTITDSILALVGIGAGTALGAALIDGTSAPASTPAPSAAGQEAVAAPVAVAAKEEPQYESMGFLRDVLSDNREGISFHRFQMFAWTLILGVIFLASVYNSLAMPQFSATLLGLMGISSGTYLGFKFPENRKS
jgi:hypothetical protein